MFFVPNGCSASRLQAASTVSAKKGLPRAPMTPSPLSESMPTNFLSPAATADETDLLGAEERHHHWTAQRSCIASKRAGNLERNRDARSVVIGPRVIPPAACRSEMVEVRAEHDNLGFRRVRPGRRDPAENVEALGAVARDRESLVPFPRGQGFDIASFKLSRDVFRRDALGRRARASPLELGRREVPHVSHQRLCGEGLVCTDGREKEN